MQKIELKKMRSGRRKKHVRRTVKGTGDRPRLTVYKSLRNIIVQVIDDEKKVTLAAASSQSKDVVARLAGKTKVEAAALVGEEIARRALERGVKKVAFDRNRNLYHGRIKALADAARKTGLEF